MNNRGISPVIATVIIVAVAIAIAIAVAFWMTGIVGLFTGFEEVQVVSAYAQPATGNTTGWNIVLEIKNTGTSAATIDYIFINNRPSFHFTGNTALDGASVTLSTSNYASTVEDTTYSGTLSPGKSATITIQLQDTTNFSSGQSVEIKIHTASGKEYPKLIVLP